MPSPGLAWTGNGRSPLPTTIQVLDAPKSWTTAGTPWCVTIDFDTIEKPGDTFTLRERDSMKQTRITEAELFKLLGVQVY